MLEFESATAMKIGGAARNISVRPCGTCRSAASSVYCRSSCDARILSAAGQHERTWVCQSCERAPAAFQCKADSAPLCATCDDEIHSANPLARRHHRVPIQTIPGSFYGPFDADTGGLMLNAADDFLTEEADDEDEDEAASWLLPDPMKNDDDEIRAAVLAGGVDEYVDLDEYNQFNEGYNNQKQQFEVAQSSYGGDSIVPMQFHEGKNELGLETGYNYPASISQTVSMDVGVLPESASSTMSHVRAPKGTIDLFSSSPIQMPSQLTPMDREARVLKYRAKKKTRKFEKTIRYASRKAYAETRPRIKGRFSKSKGADIQVDHMFSSESLMADTSYLHFRPQPESS